MVTFVSTRGKSERVGLGNAVLGGLAPDGGLYVPEHIPALPPALSTKEAAATKPEAFPDLAARMLSAWTGDWLTGAQLRRLVDRVFTFPVPLVQLEGLPDAYILELFHGPTLSFKDFGARMLGGLLGLLQQDSDKETIVLVATSGDTGSAVADGCSGIEGVRVVLLYPKGGVSPTQEMQLTLRRPGVTPVSVDGPFDACQRLVKGAFSNPLPPNVRLTTANSINVGRLLAQMIYYVHAARCLQHNDPLLPAPVFCVPSGNLGNLTAGMLAYKAGMPAHRFVAAHNANDFFPTWLGDPETSFAPSVKTLSNAMDVGAPSNFERLTWLFKRDELSRLIHGDRVSDDETLKQMRITKEKTGYIADPHTAVALRAAKRSTTPGQPVIVLSTAHPAKFPETVREATGVAADVPERLSALARAEHHAESIADNQSELTAIISA